jgi:hypothetical protein
LTQSLVAIITSNSAALHCSAVAVDCAEALNDRISICFEIQEKRIKLCSRPMQGLSLLVYDSHILESKNLTLLKPICDC